MEEVVVEDVGMLLGNFSIGLAYIKEDGVYVPAHPPSNCRSQVQDALYSFRNPQYNTNRLKRGAKLNPDKTILFVSTETKNRFVSSNLEFLYLLEDKYGLERTEVLSVKNKKESLVFVGDKLWQSCLWKMSIYTLLIKKASGVEDTWRKKQDNYLFEVFSKHEEELMSKIKTDMEPDLISDRFDSWNAEYWRIHSWAGFFSILAGYNENMRTRLGLKLMEDAQHWVI